MIAEIWIQPLQTDSCVPSIYMLQNLFNNWFLKLDMQKMTAAAVMLALVLGGILIGSQKIEEKWGQGM